MQDNYIGEIKAAWKTFTNKHKVIDIVNPVIAESWERSKMYGIDYDKPQWNIASDDELKLLFEKNKELLKIAKPIMANLSCIVMGTGSILVLVDADGYLIENVGDEYLRKKIWPLGANFSENEIGTSAPGICIKIDKPLQVSGAENYCLFHHNWACSAAPIHDSNDKLIGALCMATGLRNANKHTLGIVVAAAYSIENEISLQRSHELIDITIETISDGLIITDKNLKINEMNDMAEKILGLKRENAFGINIKDIVRNVNFEDIFTVKDMSLEKIYCDFTVENRKILCNSKITIVKKNNECIGISIMFKEMKYLHNTVNSLFGNKAMYNFNDIVTINNQMKKVIREAEIFANARGSILIEGESGTGKELFAHSIHNNSLGCEGPFVAVNCASIPRDLVESELFGYEGGSFTGASKEGKPGKFELANGGTIFLDEIGELALDIQAKLLRVLDSHTITRIGGKSPIKLSVRVIGATNRNLHDEVFKKNFREDLYYRLNVFKLNIPPLRERIEDIDVYAKFFIRKLNKINETNKQIDNKVFKILRKYNWKGNVREIQNVIERLYYLSDGDIINEEYLPREIVNEEYQYENQLIDQEFSINSIEKEVIENALLKTKGHVINAAKILNISKSSIYRKIKNYNININLYKY